MDSFTTCCYKYLGVGREEASAEEEEEEEVVTEVLLVGAGIDAQDVCGVSVTDLMTCKPAVTPPSPSEPSDECCAVVSKVDMDCLCTYKNSPLWPFSSLANANFTRLHPVSFFFSFYHCL
ncbi:hypothetical protein VNO80_17360 [Phaseolus coccineus]|uniref:Bifunctional inhibitor/plant lipid transfer protein/seed storage helical domain-containing protein n=1 Tax=Phaseolus coccineus TaxID=3886 RepID=A0AAN9MQ99_PHACN